MTLFTVFGLTSDASGERLVAVVLEGDHVGSVREWDSEDDYTAAREVVAAETSGEAAEMFRREDQGETT
ncbi:hypothetical protein ACFWNT_43500 [Streptomyces sp. NPDC058409]|uniref:hypothetical protein n=1 Tax=Streptomyces sp. NPDC058409 TaxID=3346484 RepID=UPI0036564EAD